MFPRALIVAGAFIVIALVVRLWRRPPRLARLDLRYLAIRGPAIVQFTTPWCGPCKTAAPHLRRAAGAAGLAYAEIDVADRPDIARRYHIRRVPTIAVAGANGRVLGTWTALPPNGEIGDAARLAAS